MNHLVWILLLSLGCLGCSQSTAPSTLNLGESLSLEDSNDMLGMDDTILSDFDEDEFADFDDEFSTELPTAYDPIESWNRGVFRFNDGAYRWVFRPMTRVYKAITPEPVRTGTRNFFHNITMPVRAVNCLLQGKFESAGLEVARFGVNSVVGVFGCADPAAEVFDWQSQDEDLGQTLGAWGLTEGPYLVWPLLGPGNVRDALGRGGDYFLKPLSYADAWELELVLKGFEYTNLASSSIDQYDLIRQEALEPYVAIRDGYLQYRRRQVQE